MNWICESRNLGKVTVALIGLMMIGCGRSDDGKSGDPTPKDDAPQEPEAVARVVLVTKDWYQRGDRIFCKASALVRSGPLSLVKIGPLLDQRERLVPNGDVSARAATRPEGS